MAFVRVLSIRGCTISFYVANTVDTINPNDVTHVTAVAVTQAVGQDFIHQKISYMGKILERLPEIHCRLLEEVPIVIWNMSGSGGWYEPGSRKLEIWFGTGSTRRGTGVNIDQFSRLPQTNGVISITQRSLRNERTDCGLTLTHEVGHCVDYNMGTRGRYDGLTSSPPNRRDSYRQGNRPYQGQKYVRNGVALDYPDCLNEFKAETYSRRIMETRTMCRHNEADPPCENHSIPCCNVRLQRDLFHTQAFQAIGYPRIFHYLPLARDSIMVEGVSETTSSGIRGPAGRSQERRSNRGQLSPHAQSRRPGPVGRA